MIWPKVSKYGQSSNHKSTTFQRFSQIITPNSRASPEPNSVDTAVLVYVQSTAQVIHHCVAKITNKKKRPAMIRRGASGVGTRCYLCTIAIPPCHEKPPIEVIREPTPDCLTSSELWTSNIRLCRPSTVQLGGFVSWPQRGSITTAFSGFRTCSLLLES